MKNIITILHETWHIFKDSSIYILFGLFMAGIIKLFLNPQVIGHHLGHKRFISVIKAALLGIPLPLCCCGVLPAAAALKKQGANNGATSSFLISTPETGIDSLAITYALMDPIITIARPITAFITAILTGVTQNLVENYTSTVIKETTINSFSTMNICRINSHYIPNNHHHKHYFYTFKQKIHTSLIYALRDLWKDMVFWYLGGLLLTGIISVLIPEETIGRYLGGGIYSMLAMLLINIPLYICASASTPIAAALVLKGVSPGTILVFLVAGPATNLTILTVIWKFMGKKATIIYLLGISICTIFCGLTLDKFYTNLGFQPHALMGQASEFIPEWIRLSGTLLLIIISLPIIIRRLQGYISTDLTYTLPINHQTKHTSETSTCNCLTGPGRS